VIVVTGASGFIGGAVVAALARCGASVLAACRHCVTHDLPVSSVFVDDYSVLQPPNRDTVLVHLAEPNDIALAEQRGDAFLAERTASLAQLLNKDWGATVYASSAEVYGDSIATLRRTDEPAGARGIYARAKLACEREVVARGGAVARLGNVYGPGMPSRNVLSDILRQIPSRGPLTVRNRRPVRDYIWIEDAAEALAMLAISRASGIWNIGTGERTSVLGLAQIALALSGQSDRPVVASLQDERESSLVLDISKTVNALGWRPRTSVAEGIAKLLGPAA